MYVVKNPVDIFHKTLILYQLILIALFQISLKMLSG